MNCDFNYHFNKTIGACVWLPEVKKDKAFYQEKKNSPNAFLFIFQVLNIDWIFMLITKILENITTKQNVATSFMCIFYIIYTIYRVKDCCICTEM